MNFQNIFSQLWKVKIFCGNICSLYSNAYFLGTVMPVCLSNMVLYIWHRPAQINSDVLFIALSISYIFSVSSVLSLPSYHPPPPTCIWYCQKLRPSEFAKYHRGDHFIPDPTVVAGFPMEEGWGGPHLTSPSPLLCSLSFVSRSQTLGALGREPGALPTRAPVTTHACTVFSDASIYTHSEHVSIFSYEFIFAII